MTVKELMDQLSKLPQDALVGCGNDAVMSIDALPSYYDGCHRLPRDDKFYGKAVEFMHHRQKVVFRSNSLNDILVDRFPLYTPVYEERFKLSDHNKVDSVGIADHSREERRDQVMLDGLDICSVSTWEGSWKLLLKAYELTDLSQHEQVALFSIHEEVKSLWNSGAKPPTAPLSYPELGIIADKLLTAFPSARDAANTWYD